MATLQSALGSVPSGSTPSSTPAPSSGGAATATGCCMTTLSGCLHRTQIDCESIGGTFYANDICDHEGLGGTCTSLTTGTV